MNFAAGFADGFVAQRDELVVEWMRINLPNTIPSGGDVSLFRKTFAGVTSVLQQSSERGLVEVPLIESDPTIFNNAGNNARLRRARTNRANAAMTFGELINQRAHLRRGEKSVLAPVHGRTARMRGLAVK